MSVLVKGMRMPENCIKCPMCFGGMCYVMPAEVDESRVAPTVEEALKQGKPDWCPLIEIPAHGRLIDADKMNDLLLKEKERAIGNENKLGAFAVGFAMGFIHKEPTVVEGSEDT